MMKGGGKPKGRPRKPGNEVTHSQSAVPTRGDGAESSHIDESKSPNELNVIVDLPIELEIHTLVTVLNEEMNTEKAKEATSQKIEEGVKPPLQKRGMALNYVVPILKQGVPTAKLNKSDVEKEFEKWKTAIILYVIGDTPTISYLKFFLHKQCENLGNVEIFLS